MERLFSLHALADSVITRVFIIVGEQRRRLGIGQTTYYRYEGVRYPIPKRKGKIRIFSEKEFKRVRRTLSRIPRLKVNT
jgi:hypothetical protein